MQKRLIFGGLAAAIFLPTLVVGGFIFDLLVAALSAIAVMELLKMKKLEISSFEGLLTILGAVVLTLPLGNYLPKLPLDASLSAFTLVAFLILAGMVFNFPHYRLEDATYAIGISFYMGIGFHNLLLARMAGVDRVLFALFIVWATDIGAYTIGSRMGRRKLAPAISPNKSLEGFFGGIACAVAVSLVFMLFKKTLAPYNLLLMLPLVAGFSAVAQFGDLVESAIKRQFGVKDSGKIIPGHGGIFDRFDSVIFVLPLMHFFGLF